MEPIQGELLRHDDECRVQAQGWAAFVLLAAMIVLSVVFGVALGASLIMFDELRRPIVVECGCDCLQEATPRVTIYDYGQLAPPCATYEDLPEPPPTYPTQPGDGTPDDLIDPPAATSSAFKVGDKVHVPTHYGEWGIVTFVSCGGFVYVETEKRGRSIFRECEVRPFVAAAAPPATCPAAKECPPRSCGENGCLLPKFQPLPEKCPPKCPPKKLCSPCRP